MTGSTAVGRPPRPAASTPSVLRARRSRRGSRDGWALIRAGGITVGVLGAGACVAEALTTPRLSSGEVVVALVLGALAAVLGAALVWAPGPTAERLRVHQAPALALGALPIALAPLCGEAFAPVGALLPAWGAIAAGLLLGRDAAVYGLGLAGLWVAQALATTGWNGIADADALVQVLVIQPVAVLAAATLGSVQATIGALQVSLDEQLDELEVRAGRRSGTLTELRAACAEVQTRLDAWVDRLHAAAPGELRELLDHQVRRARSRPAGRALALAPDPAPGTATEPLAALRLGLEDGADVRWRSERGAGRDLDPDAARALALGAGRLVANAVRHGRPGGSIEVRVSEDGDVLRLAVENDTTAAAVGDRDGAGLLAARRSLVAADGTVTTTASGRRFHAVIELPRRSGGPAGVATRSHRTARAGLLLTSRAVVPMVIAAAATQSPQLGAVGGVIACLVVIAATEATEHLAPPRRAERLAMVVSVLGLAALPHGADLPLVAWLALRFGRFGLSVDRRALVVTALALAAAATVSFRGDLADFAAFAGTDLLIVLVLGIGSALVVRPALERTAQRERRLVAITRSLERTLAAAVDAEAQHGAAHVVRETMWLAPGPEQQALEAAIAQLARVGGAASAALSPPGGLRQAVVDRVASAVWPAEVVLLQDLGEDDGVPAPGAGFALQGRTASSAAGAAEALQASRPSLRRFAEHRGDVVVHVRHEDPLWCELDLRTPTARADLRLLEAELGVDAEVLAPDGFRLAL